MSNNKPCPACRAVGRDKSGDHLFLLEDGVTWYCNKPYHDKPYIERDGEEKKTMSIKRDSREVIEEILTCPIVGNKDRRISKETHEHFRIRTSFDESTGQPRAIHYPESFKGAYGSFKTRVFPKKFFVDILPEHKGKVPDFSGQAVCPKVGKRLLITGGEEDMCAFYEAMKARYPDQTPCVVSLPRGENGSHETIRENLDFLSGFEEIVIATDMDEEGRKAIASIIPIIGTDKSRIFEISEKDCSDMLVKGKQKEMINAFYNAKEYRPSNVIVIEDILEEAITPVPWGLSYPFPTLTKLTYGMKDGGEIIGIGAAPGAGKTTLLQQIQKHLMFVHKEPIAIFDIEEGAIVGLKKLIGSVMNRPIHLPDCDYSIEEARKIGRSFYGLAHFYGGDSENWNEVDDAIKYYASKGISKFFVDPLSALVEHLSASEANQELGKIMRSMRKYRKHQGLTFFHANHLNNPLTGKDHGEGGAVRGSQFSGSRAQWKYSTLLLGLEGNQLAEDTAEKHKRRLGVLKDRLGGHTGYVDLIYNPSTGNLEEENIVCP